MSWVAAVLLLAAGAAEEVKQPRLRLDTSQEPAQLVIEAMPDVLDDEDVAPELTKGLTTTFAFRVEARDGAGRKVVGAGRVEVLYKLWDEVFVVTRTAWDGRRQQVRLESREALEAWWRRLELPVLAPGAGTAALDRQGRWQVQVELSVIPFSQSEERDTQRWFSDSLEASGSAAETVGDAAETKGEPLGSVLNLLLATSIQRQALVRHRWTVPVAPAAVRSPPRPASPGTTP